MTNKELQKKFKNIEAWLEVFACKLGYDYKKISKEFDDAENIKIITEEKPHHEFKVGDRVQFKSWDEMEKEFGLDRFAYIDCRNCFTKEMKHLCGTYATIKEVYGNDVELKDFTAEGNTDFGYSLDMLKPATDEPKCKFKVGDKVKVNTKGKLGVIFDILYCEDYWVYKISYFNGQTDYVYEKDLEPYTEPRWTFTDDEKVILRNLPEKYMWLARDAVGRLFAYYNEMPHKDENTREWTNCDGYYSMMFVFNHLFQSIKWEDETACKFRKYL